MGPGAHVCQNSNPATKIVYAIYLLTKNIYVFTLLLWHTPIPSGVLVGKQGQLHPPYFKGGETEKNLGSFLGWLG